MDGFLESINGYIEGGGFVMVPLIVAAGLLWYGLGYRLVTLRRGFLGDVRGLIRSTRAGSEAPQGGIVAKAVAEGVKVAETGVTPLRPHLDVAFGEVEDQLTKYDTIVKTIVAVAPLGGLLGTVAGMMETFDSLAEMAMFTQGGGIAAGISQALLTTQMGLAVAIPGLLVGRILRRRQETLQIELEKVKDILCAQHGGATA